MMIKTFSKPISKKPNPNMNKQKLAIIILIFIFFGAYDASTSAQGRECSRNGRSYRDGYIIGDYQCQDGEWVRIR